MDFAKKFKEGLTYKDFLDKYSTADQLQRWQAVSHQVRLSASQTALLKSFVRDMPVIVVAGTWCGDCVEQCPIFDHFARETPKIQLRFFDRNSNSDLASELAVCGGPRVPAVLFLSEDGFPCGRYGDRTLSKYRDLANKLSGAACSTGIADITLMDSVIQEWLDQFERIQLMLRTSNRLRQEHND